MEILKIKNLKKSYKKSNKELMVLDNININFSNNKLYCIKGKSGSGKTTLIEIIGLLKSANSGSIILNNKDILNAKEKEKAEIRNSEIGFIFQSFYLVPTMNVLDNVLLPLLIKNKKINDNDREKAISLLKKFDVYDRISHFPKELSGGEQQRVAIARALINDPKIILADEPTGSLDSENEEIVLKYLYELSKDNKCVIIVSHSKSTEKIADEVLEIKNGALIKCKK